MEQKQQEGKQMNRKRKPGESFKQYRANLKSEERSMKAYLRGRLLWNSQTDGLNGTYSKKRYGPLGRLS